MLAGDRQAYRINVVRGPANSSLPILSLFPAAVAVVDGETGIVLRLTSYIGDRPVRRCELRDITPATGDLTIDIPPDLPVTEETGPGGAGHPRSGPYRTGFPWKAAGAAAGQVAAGVAKEAGKSRRRLPAPAQRTVARQDPVDRRPGLGSGPRPGPGPGGPGPG